MTEPLFVAVDAIDVERLAAALCHRGVRQWIGDEWGEIGTEADFDRKALAQAIVNAYKWVNER